MKLTSSFLFTRSFILLLSLFSLNNLHPLVSPIIPGQSLWCITQRIGQTTDTILDTVTQILDTCGTASTVCSPTGLSQLDVVGTDTLAGIVIVAPGNYCFSGDITGNLTVLSSCVTVNLNSRCLTGVVTLGDGVTNYSNIKIINGFINPLPPLNAAQASTPAFTISSNVQRVLVSNCVVECADPVKIHIAGRNAMQVDGTFNTITKSIIKPGDVLSTTTLGPDGTIYDITPSGKGIVISGNENIIVDSTIYDGNISLDATLTTSTFNPAILIQDFANNNYVNHCTFTSAIQDRTASVIQGTLISSACIIIENNSLSSTISYNTFIPPLISEALVTAGEILGAIFDSSSTSGIYGNFANNIQAAPGGSTPYIIHGSSGSPNNGFLLNNPPDNTAVNPFSNYYLRS